MSMAARICSGPVERFRREQGDARVRDKVTIRDLKVDCVIGIQPKERVMRQLVILNITMWCDHSKAARSDDIDDTVDYKILKDRLVEDIGETEYFLIERMAERIAEICLADARVGRVVVTVDKPGALTGARSVAVEVDRQRDD